MTKDQIQTWATQAKGLPPKHPLRYLLVDLSMMAQDGGVVHVDASAFKTWEGEMGLGAEDALARIDHAAEAGWLILRHRRGLDLEIQLVA